MHVRHGDGGHELPLGGAQGDVHRLDGVDGEASAVGQLLQFQKMVEVVPSSKLECGLVQWHGDLLAGHGDKWEEPSAGASCQS